MQQKTILTYGTFDLFHIGHLHILRRLKATGDRLIVGVSTDDFNSIKGKKTIVPYNQRAEIVAAITYVDLVIPENNWGQKVLDIKENNVDVFAMGSDWSGKFDHLNEHCEVMYLPRTESVSSTEIKVALETTLKLNKSELRKHFEILQQLLNGIQ